MIIIIKIAALCNNFPSLGKRKRQKREKRAYDFNKKRKYKRAVLSKIALKTHFLFHTKQDKCKNNIFIRLRIEK